MAILETMCKENLTSSGNLLGEHHDITMIRILKENVYGREHPDTLVAIYNLAKCLTQMANAEGDTLHVER
ncbi:hypothetical protein HYALB_00001246 [Hymenoscyphus albidus]|uniref:Kinesin light chain n=1 Tax=Hymenoscyphus albidus TaxID=595503 RepID=A0A9N9Q2X5_9HELO|nr:hypothetical protein HYALB_00001246 [Hymenoscyphus albidus]